MVCYGDHLMFICFDLFNTGIIPNFDEFSLEITFSFPSTVFQWHQTYWPVAKPMSVTEPNNCFLPSESFILHDSLTFVIMLSCFNLEIFASLNFVRTLEFLEL